MRPLTLAVAAIRAMTLGSKHLINVAGKVGEALLLMPAESGLAVTSWLAGMVIVAELVEAEAEASELSLRPWQRWLRAEERGRG
jgi:hypothetical protein